MDAPASRFIRIGNASIGLMGLDAALNVALGRQMDDQEATDFLYEQIRSQNYVPSGSEGAYRKALLTAYRKLCRPEQAEEAGMVIRIFGTGCVSCSSLQVLVMNLLDRMGMAADLEQISDPDEIGRAGVTMTPALMINGKLKSAGLLPAPAQVEQWLRELGNS